MVFVIKLNDLELNLKSVKKRSKNARYLISPLHSLIDSVFSAEIHIDKLQNPMNMH